MRWLELTVEVDVEAVEAVSEILGRLGHGAAVRPTRLIRDPDDELAASEDPTAPYEMTAHLPDDAGRARGHRPHRARALAPAGVRPAAGGRAARATGGRPGLDRCLEGRLSARNASAGCLIVPSWLEPPTGTDDVVLRLDPGMAFGTGLHPTTRACLELLQRVGPMPPRVLDVGSGSGILGLAALALGAGSVDALDTDPVAVEATLANAATNGLAGRIAARAGTPDPDL